MGGFKKRDRRGAFGTPSSRNPAACGVATKNCTNKSDIRAGCINALIHEFP